MSVLFEVALPNVAAFNSYEGTNCWKSVEFFFLFLTARRKVLQQSKLPGYLERNKQVFSLFSYVGSFFFSFIYFIGFYVHVTLWHDELPADVSIFVTAFRFNDTRIFCILKHINHSKRHKE